MSYVVFLLSALLAAAALSSAYLSLDLMPTGPGLLYAFSAAVAGAAAILTLVAGLVIRRIDRLARLVVEARAAAVLPPVAPTASAAPSAPVEGLVEVVAVSPAGAPLQVSAEASAAAAPTPPQDGGAAVEAAGEGPDQAAEEPVNENRTGHLPTLAAIERAIETPQEPPSLIGRYTSGGATYMIFADGSIEAETTDGTFKFPSMGDFKRYLAERRETKPEAKPG